MKSKDNNKRNGLISFVIMLVIGLLLLKYLIGISFWFIFGIVVFFAIVQFIWPGIEIIYKSKLVAILLVVLFLGSLGKFLWQTNYPRSFNKIETTKSSVDQWFAKIMGDNTETMAVDIWEIQKSKASNIFLVYYDSLLVKGKTAQAADTLKKFNKKWDVDLLKECSEDSKKNREDKTNKSESPVDNQSRSNQIRVVTFNSGTYQLELKPNEVVRLKTFPSKNGCGLLAMSSPRFNYQVKFDNSGWMNDGVNVRYPYMRNPECELRSSTGDVIQVEIK